MGRREKSDGRRTSLFSTGSARGEGERSLNGKSLNILDTYEMNGTVPVHRQSSPELNRGPRPSELSRTDLVETL